MTASSATLIRQPAEVTAICLRTAQRRYRKELTANFRSYLAQTVTVASPLLLDVCSEWRIDLEALLRRLRPPAAWPYPSRSSPYVRHRARLREGEAVHRGVSATVAGDTLDTRCWLGEAYACTADGELSLWLMQRYPETVLGSLPGRELNSVVEHAVLALQPYRIIAACSIGHGTVIRAEAPMVPYHLPWV
jgi:hypothetical protein